LNKTFCSSLKRIVPLLTRGLYSSPLGDYSIFHLTFDRPVSLSEVYVATYPSPMRRFCYWIATILSK